MIIIRDNSKCSGCHACATACPKSCIEMVEDKEGFFYPCVDKNKCIDCGICIKACPILTPKETVGRLDEIEAFAAYAKNEEMRLQSSSGGVFTELATYILENGGVVFGAYMDENCVVRHKCVDTVDMLRELRGSKYVQSVIGDSYKRAEELLKEGETVFFTGTPCQIGGLYSYLKKSYPNLITQDLICHGVPSPLVWREYVKYKEKEYGSPVKQASFRNKDTGWKSYSMHLCFENAQTYKTEHGKDAYMKCFLSDKALRPSCYSCAFKQRTRQSDITLADFWGVKDVMPEMNDNKGTSLVIVNSPKGKELFNSILDKLEYKLADLEKALKHNPSMVKSTLKPMERRGFVKCVSRKGFIVAYDKYSKNTIVKSIRRKIYGAMRKIKK